MHCSILERDKISNSVLGDLQPQARSPRTHHKVYFWLRQRMTKNQILTIPWNLNQGSKVYQNTVISLSKLDLEEQFVDEYLVQLYSNRIS